MNPGWLGQWVLVSSVIRPTVVQPLVCLVLGDFSSFLSTLLMLVLHRRARVNSSLRDSWIDGWREPVEVRYWAGFLLFIVMFFLKISSDSWGERAYIYRQAISFMVDHPFGVDPSLFKAYMLGQVRMGVEPHMESAFLTVVSWVGWGWLLMGSCIVWALRLVIPRGIRMMPVALIPFVPLWFWVGVLPTLMFERFYWPVWITIMIVLGIRRRSVVLVLLALTISLYQVWIINHCGLPGSKRVCLDEGRWEYVLEHLDPLNREALASKAFYMKDRHAAILHDSMMNKRYFTTDEKLYSTPKQLIDSL